MRKPEERQKSPGQRETARGAGQRRGRVRYRRLPRVPPPDSTVWPEQYRGPRWKPAYAILFAGKCQLCAYSFPPSKWRQGMDRCRGMTRLLLCTNHPDGPGELLEVLPIETCRNFKAKSWRRPPAKAAPDRSSPAYDESDPTVRRIPLSNGLFATVDAADYGKLSGYRWHASRRGGKIYACCNTRRRTVYMHHMILRPRRGDKWAAEIRCRGKRYHLGRFKDEIEAAKARDRKAHELHGEHAYLNFPEDYHR